MYFDSKNELAIAISRKKVREYALERSESEILHDLLDIIDYNVKQENTLTRRDRIAENVLFNSQYDVIKDPVYAAKRAYKAADQMCELGSSNRRN